MPRKTNANQINTAMAGDDDGASTDHTSVDGEAGSEEANTVHQAHGANTLATIDPVNKPGRTSVYSHHEVPSLSRQRSSNDSSSSKRKSDVLGPPSHVSSRPVCGGRETTATT